MSSSNTSHEETFDIKDEYSTDQDICSQKELYEIFPNRYSFSKQVILAKNDSPKLRCTKIVSNSSETHLAIANNSGEIHFIDVNAAKLLNTAKQHEKDVTELKFVDNNLLYSSSLDQLVKCYDMRTNDTVAKYMNIDGVKKPFSCLDINCSGNLIAAGTPYISNEDAHIVFWDIRDSNKNMGSYYESHSDEITTVKFHPSKSHYLLSGAMDNLINIYDISKDSEFNALTDCINFETTPDTIYWDPHSNHPTKLFVINYPQIIQYWDVQDTNPAGNLTAQSFCESIKRKDESQCHYISCSFDNSLNPVIMGSSNLGLEKRENVCVRMVTYDRDSNKLVPHSTLDLKKENKVSHIVDSIYMSNSDSFVILMSNVVQIWKKNKKRNISDDSYSKSFKKIKS